jgi:hypothetical protein
LPSLIEKIQAGAAKQDARTGRLTACMLSETRNQLSLCVH